MVYIGTLAKETRYSRDFIHYEMPLAQGNQILHFALYRRGADVAPTLLIQACDARWESMLQKVRKP